jgi:hypothetical protein
MTGIDSAFLYGLAAGALFGSIVAMLACTVALGRLRIERRSERKLCTLGSVADCASARP